MRYNKNKTLLILLAVLLSACLCGCAVLGFTEENAQPEAEETPAAETGRIPDNATSLDLRGAALTAEEIERLMQVPTLLSLDIRDNDISEDIFSRLSAALPNCEITWSVPFGARKVDSDAASLTMEAGDEIPALQAVLPYFPALTDVDMTALSVEAEPLITLMEAYPDVRFAANVSVCGISADTTATALDLSTTTGVSAYTTDELVTALALFPAMERVDLTGQTLSFDEMDRLVTAYPDVTYAWSFSFMDKTCTSEDTFLDLSGISMRGTDEVAKIIRYMPALTALDMCDCGIPDEQMGALREQFPDIAINWRIQVGHWSMRTDVTAFSTGKTENSSQVSYDRKRGPSVLKTDYVQPLKYCTELVALDIGHQKVDDLSFISNLKKLRFLIIAAGEFTDISPVANCTQLEFLEVFQNYIADFSPLLSLTNLKCLNCGATKSPDADAEPTAVIERANVLKQLTSLERLWCIHAGFSEETVAEIQAALPNCKVVGKGVHPTANYWRNGNELYVEMQGLFELKVLN